MCMHYTSTEQAEPNKFGVCLLAVCAHEKSLSCFIAKSPSPMPMQQPMPNSSAKVPRRNPRGHCTTPPSLTKINSMVVNGRLSDPCSKRPPTKHVHVFFFRLPGMLGFCHYSNWSPTSKQSTNGATNAKPSFNPGGNPLQATNTSSQEKAPRSPPPAPNHEPRGGELMKESHKGRPLHTRSHGCVHRGEGRGRPWPFPLIGRPWCQGSCSFTSSQTLAEKE
jgi:hypothetical protein